jgi:anti-anti-sigma factor
MDDRSQRPGTVKVSLVPEPPYLVLDLRGELDLCSANQVPRDEYASRRDLTTVLVDLGDLTFCDATGLRALLNFRRIHQAQGRSVEVVRTNPFILRLMKICGITDRLEVAPPPKTTAV